MLLNQQKKLQNHLKMKPQKRKKYLLKLQQRRLHLKMLLNLKHKMLNPSQFLYLMVQKKFECLY